MSKFLKLLGWVIICTYVFILLTAKINELIEKAKLYKAMREAIQADDDNGGGRVNGVKMFLKLENSESPELRFDKKYNVKIIETGEDYKTERWYLDVEIESIDRYFIRLKRLNYNSKQDPYPKVTISKIVEVEEVEE